MKRAFAISIIAMMLFFFNLAYAQKAKDNPLKDNKETRLNNKSDKDKADQPVLEKILKTVTNKIDEDKTPYVPTVTNRKTENKDNDKPVRNEKPRQEKPVVREQQTRKPVYNKPEPVDDNPYRNLNNQNRSNNRQNRYYERDDTPDYQYQKPTTDYYRNNRQDNQKPNDTIINKTENKTEYIYFKPETGQRSHKETNKPSANLKDRNDRASGQDAYKPVTGKPFANTDSKPINKDSWNNPIKDNPKPVLYDNQTSKPPSDSRPPRPNFRDLPQTPANPPHNPDGDGNNHYPGDGNNHNWGDNHNGDNNSWGDHHWGDNNSWGDHQWGDNHHWGDHNWGDNHHWNDHHWGDNHNWSWYDWNHNYSHHHYYTFGLHFNFDWNFYDPWYYADYYYPYYDSYGWYPCFSINWDYPHHYYWRPYRYTYIRPAFYYDFTYYSEKRLFDGYLVANASVVNGFGSSGLNGRHNHPGNEDAILCNEDCPVRGYGIMVQRANGDKVFFHLDRYGSRLAKNIVNRYGKSGKRIYVQVKGILDQDTHTITTYTIHRLRWNSAPVLALQWHSGWSRHRHHFWS